MRKVRVHLQDGVGGASQGPGEGGEIGPSQPLFFRPVQDLDPPRMRRGQGLGDGSGSVRRGVVDDQKAKAWFQGKDLLGQGSQIFSLVIGGQDNEGVSEGHVSVFLYFFGLGL